MSYDDSESYNSTKSLTAMFKVACATKGVNVMPPLSYHDTRRLIDINDEEVTAAEDADELGEPLVEAAESLAHEERVGNSVVTVEPLQSLARGQVAKLHPARADDKKRDRCSRRLYRLT